MTDVTKIEETKLKMKLQVVTVDQVNVLDPDVLNDYLKSRILEAFWTAYHTAEDLLGAKPTSVIFGSGLRSLLLPAINEELSSRREALESRLKTAKSDIQDVERTMNALDEDAVDYTSHQDDLQSKIDKLDTVIKSLENQLHMMHADVSEYSATGVIPGLVPGVGTIEYYVGCQVDTVSITFVRMNAEETLHLD